MLDAGSSLQLAARGEYPRAARPAVIFFLEDAREKGEGRREKRAGGMGPISRERGRLVVKY
jgi:hypothetical protein